MTNEPGYEGYNITDPRVKDYKLNMVLQFKYSICFVLKI